MEYEKTECFPESKVIIH